jgi:hypothetical protein
LRAELLEADRDRRRLQSALAKLNPELADLHASQTETLPQNAQDLEHLLAVLYTSRSWRLTAPLRWLGNLMHGRKTPLSPAPTGQRTPEELRELITAVYASRSWRLGRFISRRLGAARGAEKTSPSQSQLESNGKESGLNSPHLQSSQVSESNGIATARSTPDLCKYLSSR